MYLGVARYFFEFLVSCFFSHQKQKHTLSKNIQYEITWRLSGRPFLTAEGRLVDACRRAIKTITGKDTQLATGGGTSDGRFIAPTGAEVVELGATNATIHQIDEHTDIAQLSHLKNIYKAVIKSLLTAAA